MSKSPTPPIWGRSFKFPVRLWKQCPRPGVPNSRTHSHTANCLNWWVILSKPTASWLAQSTPQSIWWATISFIYARVSPYQPYLRHYYCYYYAVCCERESLLGFRRTRSELLAVHLVANTVKWKLNFCEERFCELVVGVFGFMCCFWKSVREGLDGMRRLLNGFWYRIFVLGLSKTIEYFHAFL